MTEKNQHKKVVHKDEKIEQHKKSIKVSASKTKPAQKTGTKDEDWNDPTGNSHLGS